MGKPVVQAVDAFNNQNILRSELQIIPFVFTKACFKVKTGHFHPFSRQQIRHILIEFFHINGFQTFEIIVALFVQRRLIPVYEIIVHRDGMRYQAMGFQLDGKTMGKGGLS